MKYYINVYYMYEDLTIIQNFTLLTASCKFLQNAKYNNLCKLQSHMCIHYNFSCCVQHSSNEDIDSIINSLFHIHKKDNDYITLITTLVLDTELCSLF